MRVGSVVVLVALVACQHPGELTSERDLADRLIEVRDKMHVAYRASDAMRTAIAYGDLERVKVEAQRVAGLAEVEILPEWRPYVDNVRTAALTLTTVADPISAAKQLAVMGWRCAQCHEAVPSKTNLPRVGQPPPGPKLSATMASHDWATARMWDGLVGASAEQWLEGATALEGTRLAITAEGDVPGHELGIADDVARIHMLARRAQRTNTSLERAELFGTLLAACVRCHHTIRD